MALPWEDGSGRDRCSRASDLQIAGIQRLSSVDWPGHLALTVFAQGCPWSCPYCHNHAIIDMRTPGQVPWSEVVSLLHRRRGLLDAVVFSGGEPTRQGSLIDAAHEVRDLGFSVGVHTAGAYPRRLEVLLEEDIVDWVALDIKATKSNYAAVAGVEVAGARAWESLRVVLDWAERRMSEPRVKGELSAKGEPSAMGESYEVRLTAYPHSAGDEVEVARQCRDLGVRFFALQQARDTGAPVGFRADAPGWDERFTALADTIVDFGFHQFTVRRSSE